MKEKENAVKAVLIASGGGTDADSIMKSHGSGCIPEIEIVGLVSTKMGAGCLEKAKVNKVYGLVVDRKVNTEEGLNKKLEEWLVGEKVELVFLVGCVVKIYPIKGIAMYNIHPAEPHQFGGDGMYGIEVHKRVMADVIDQIERGKRSAIDTFYTYPTVHEATIDYDSGDILMQCAVKVPNWLIVHYAHDKLTIEQCAENLQKVVLPYEWIMLPAAVRMAAKRIMDERR